MDKNKSGATTVPVKKKKHKRLAVKTVFLLVALAVTALAFVFSSEIFGEIRCSIKK